MQLNIGKSWRILPKPLQALPIIYDFLSQTYTILQNSIQNENMERKYFLLILNNIVKLLKDLKILSSCKNYLNKYFELAQELKDENFNEENIQLIEDLIIMTKPLISFDNIKCLIFKYHKKIENYLNSLELKKNNDHSDSKKFKDLFYEYCSKKTPYTLDYLMIKIYEIILSNVTSVFNRTQKVLIEATINDTQKHFIMSYLDESQYNKPNSIKDFLQSLKSTKIETNNVYENCIILDQQVNEISNLEKNKIHDIIGSSTNIKLLYEQFMILKVKETLKTYENFSFYKKNHITDCLTKINKLHKKQLRLLVITIVYRVITDSSISFEFKSDLEKFYDMIQTFELLIENIQYVKLYEMIESTKPYILDLIDLCRAEMDDLEKTETNASIKYNDDDFEI